MNGNTKKNLALGALVLGVGLAIGAVIGNDKTRNGLVEKGKGWFNNQRKD